MIPHRRRYTFWINDTEAAGLKRIKGDQGTTESEQIRQAIRDWLKRKGVEVKPERKRAVPRKRS